MIQLKLLTKIKNNLNYFLVIDEYFKNHNEKFNTKAKNSEIHRIQYVLIPERVLNPR